MSGSPGTEPVRVGLVGAGRWARTVHGPLHTSPGPTTLVGVWARRPQAATKLAEELGVPPVERFEELLDICEAVDFSVPPAVQAGLAPSAARAGRALLLEKPLAADLDGAREVATAVAEAGVASVVVLTRRFHSRTRGFLERAARLRAAGPLAGGQAAYLHGGLLPGGFLAGPPTWRTEPGGMLLDIGPHLLDVVQEAAGRIEAVRAEGDADRYVGLTTRHEGGAVVQSVLSGMVASDPPVTRVDLYSSTGTLHWDTAGMDQAECWVRLREELAGAVRSAEPVTADAAHGLRVQVVLEAARLSLERSSWVEVREV